MYIYMFIAITVLVGFSEINTRFNPRRLLGRALPDPSCPANYPSGRSYLAARLLGRPHAS